MSNHTDKRGEGFLKGFIVAFEGIAHAFRNETHMKIHFAAAVLVILLAAILHVSLNDWVILLLLIALVIAMELINTAIERVVDLATKECHPLAKQAKDMAAGAVLVMAIASVIIGLCIFLKYF